MNQPILVTITRRHLAEFIECERGAEEDEITGPSPLTTVAILERHPRQIECRTVEEAAQVLDCCRYGTFPLHHPRVAERIQMELQAIPEVMALWAQHDRTEWGALAAVVKEAQS